MNIWQIFRTQLKQKIIVLKLWVRIQQYAAVDFQGWSKMTLKVKMAYISILEVGFEKFLDSHL